MEEDAEKLFRELKDDLSTYAGLRLRILKLTAIERTARVIAVLSHGLVFVLLAFFSILFLFLALGFFLGELLGSLALGFLAVGGLYLLLLFLLAGCKEWLRVKIMNVIIGAIQANDDEESSPPHSVRPTDT